ncbi:MAG: hypothetical protein ACRDO2_13115, partial [Nocardioidaceae bacterium]
GGIMRPTGFIPITTSLATVGAMAAGPAGQSATATTPSSNFVQTRPMLIVADPRVSDRELSPALQGVNLNEFANGAGGLWDAEAKAPNADAAAKTSRAGIGLMRFPGGSPANLYDWKRSIGPSEARECQTDGVGLGPRNETGYGPDEFMQIARAVGSQPEIVVPFPNAEPNDVANWFEYMNAPVGTNPNGGVAWAEVRQANGSADPYGVTRWEIGNEPYLATQAFWTDPSDPVRRLDHFIVGDEIEFVDQPLGRNCNFDPPPLTSRNPNQQFYFMYRLIKDGTSPVVKVGDQVWTEVPDLAAAGPTDTVYELDRTIGAITLGDGVHGVLPPRNQAVTASYTFEHEGFVSVYDALKSTAAAIGMDIEVCASWAPVSPRGTGPENFGQPSFAQEMARRGLADRYDCVAVHPYTSLGTDYWPWTSAVDAHHAHMAGDLFASAVITSLAADLRAHSAGGDATIAITELGALWFGSGPEREESVVHMPQFSSTTTHAVYMASQWLRFAQLDVTWMMGNALVPPGLRGVLGGVNTGFVYSAEAMTREALRPFFAAGNRWVDVHVLGQEDMTAPDGLRWPVLVVGAVRGPDGTQVIAVVNRHPTDSQSTFVVPAGFPHTKRVTAATVQGAAITSVNDDGTFGGDNTVTLTRSIHRRLGSGAFDYSFPPASTTVLTLEQP